MSLGLNAVDQTLSLLLIAALVAQLFSLLRKHLRADFPYFFLYLFTLCLEMIALRIVPVRTTIYGSIYFGFQTLNLAIAFAIVREIYALALHSHPALAAFGKKIVWWALAVAVLVPLTLVAWQQNAAPVKYPTLYAFFKFEQTGNFFCVLLLLMISAFLAWFPVQLSRNILVYSKGFTVFSFLRGSGIVAVILWPGQLRVISNWLLGCEIVNLLYWLVGFRSTREAATVISGHTWNPAEFDRLTQQLNSINNALSRFNQR